jgi:hypothetical protein
MKLKVLFSAMFLLLIVGFYTPASYSAVTYTVELKNDVYTAPNVYEFDIYLSRTGTTTLRLCGTQFDITFNPTMQLYGDSLTAEVLMTLDSDGNVIDQSWTSPLMDQYEPMKFTVAPGELQIITAACATRNAAGVIPVAPGVCLGRVRLTKWGGTFNNVNANLAFKFTGYNTILLAFLGGSGVNSTTDITANGTYDVSGLNNPVLLPVELTSFVSNVSGRQVNLNWETKTEINFSKFEIERALASTKDATVTWASVGTLQAAGNSNSPKKYSYTDKNLQAGKYQYRLKMIDNDGSYKLSDVVETAIAVPKDFALSQNYPNPFNPSTKIDYQVPVDAKVILEVYNITGQKVVELVNQDQQAGYYSVNFGASKLASGVYIYRIAATAKASGNNFSSIKKMMLLK